MSEGDHATMKQIASQTLHGKRFTNFPGFTSIYRSVCI
jgi:hypothetical protein